jgi:hypothetical protein
MGAIRGEEVYCIRLLLSPSDTSLKRVIELVAQEPNLAFRSSAFDMGQIRIEFNVTVHMVSPS